MSEVKLLPLSKWLLEGFTDTSNGDYDNDH